jgi:hypothetical protein
MEKFIKYAFGIFIVGAIIYAFNEYQHYKDHQRLVEMRAEYKQEGEDLQQLENYQSILEDCEDSGNC